MVGYLKWMLGLGIGMVFFMINLKVCCMYVSYVFSDIDGKFYCMINI